MAMAREENIPKEDLESYLLLNLDTERRKLRNNRVVILAGEPIGTGDAKAIIEDFEILARQNKNPITLIISSGGGNAFSGVGIIRAIRRVQAKGIKVIGEVHGEAMSMAFLILQSCDERIMGILDVIMCHGVSTFSIGDIKDLEAEQKIMNKFRDDFAKLLAERSTAPNGSPYRESGYWHAILEDNTPQFYDSKEAMEMGLIDRVE